MVYPHINLIKVLQFLYYLYSHSIKLILSVVIYEIRLL